MIKTLLTIITLIFVQHLSAAPVITIKNTTRQIIGKQVLYYEDPSNNITLNKAIEIESAGNFEPIESAVFARPSSPSTHWFTFTVKSEIQDELWINVVNQGFNTINFYLLNENGQVINTINTGAELPMETRVKKSKTFWFNLFKEKEQGTKTIYLEIVFDGILEVPIVLGGEQELIELENESELYGILFIGALMVMFIYNGFLGYFTKDIVYLYYTGYILTALLITTHINNYPLLPDVLGSHFTYQYLFFWITPVAFFIASFVITYLQLDERSPKSARIIRFLAAVSLLIGLSNLFVPTVYLTNIYQIATTLLLIACMTVGFNEWAKGSRRAKFHTIGWTINIISVFIFFAVSNGFMPYTPVSRNSMYFGVFCELVIFSIALAERLNELKREQETLNQKLEFVNDNLVSSNESLDAFNYHVSHDLKTVLNNSNALTQMIQKYNLKNDNEKVAEIADKLAKVTQNGVETVQSFLSLSVVNVLKQVNEQEIIPIQETLHSIVHLNAIDENIKIEITKDELGSIRIHKKAFDSIFMNLFTNTIKFNLQSPVAKIQFINNNNSVKIIYEDNGIGIDLTQNKNQVFAPFQRIKNSINSEGSGVGMYLVKRLIENYNGTINIESTLNNGVKFIITLPQDHLIKA